MIANEMLLVELIEIIHPEFAIRGLVLENMVRDNEDGVGNSNDRLLSASSFGDPVEPGAEIRVF